MSDSVVDIEFSLGDVEGSLPSLEDVNLFRPLCAGQEDMSISQRATMDMRVQHDEVEEELTNPVCIITNWVLNERDLLMGKLVGNLSNTAGNSNSNSNSYCIDS